MDILVADKHALIIDALKSLLTKNYPECNIYSATNKKEIFHQLKNHNFDILILEIKFGNDNAQDFINEITKEYKNVKIIILSSTSNELVINKLLKEHISGFVLKNDESVHIVTAINSALKNELYISKTLKRNTLLIDEKLFLSVREKEIVKEILNEKTTNEIAQFLNISPKTVEMNRNNLFVKLNVKNITGLVKKVLINSLLED